MIGFNGARVSPKISEELKGPTNSEHCTNSIREKPQRPQDHRIRITDMSAWFQLQTS